LIPRVSVIVPCYNERATIGLLLEALLDQDLDDGGLEIILSDGMSTDGTREAVKAFGGAHPELATRLVDTGDQHIATRVSCLHT